MPAVRLNQIKIPLALAVWGGLALLFHLLRFDPYAISESAARVILLDWTVVDHVTNPVLGLALPDLRVLLFAPLAIYWTGSIIAVKVFTLLISFCAALLFYRWARRTMSEEVALIGTGLLLIAPLTFYQINQVGIGPFLLLMFGLGQWVDEKYRQVRRRFGGWYFLQLILAAVAVSLHPAGLAQPLALMWEWRKHPIDKQHRLLVMGGLGLVVLLVLIMRLGWPALTWGDNPMTVLTDLVYVMGPNGEGPSWTTGLIPSMILVLFLLSDFRALINDLLGRMLLGGLILGVAAADPGWAMLALAIVLYRGAYRLIQFNQGFQADSLIGQRGIALVVVFALATTYMIADKAQRYDVLTAAVNPQDQVIRVLSGELDDLKKPALTISQWPARTMLATKRPTFPLPSSTAKENDLSTQLRHIRFLVFDPYDKRNANLKQLVSIRPNQLRTIMINSEAVLVENVDAENQDLSPALPK